MTEKKGTEWPWFIIEPWEDGEKIIVGPGGPMGHTLSHKDASLVCGWIKSAYAEIIKGLSSNGWAGPDSHCKDCCCARSWKALEVKSHTGKSIVEHIEELKADAERLAGALRDVLNHGCPVPGHPDPETGEPIPVPYQADFDGATKALAEFDGRKGREAPAPVDPMKYDPEDRWKS